MNPQGQNEKSKWAAEFLLSGKSPDYVKGILEKDGYSNEDSHQIILDSKNLVCEQFFTLLNGLTNKNIGLSKLPGWSSLDKEVQIYILTQKALRKQANDEQIMLIEGKLPGYWKRLVLALRFFSAAGVAFSSIAVKESLFRSYVDWDKKLLIVAWTATAYIYFSYAVQIDKIILSKNQDQAKMAVWEGTGYFEIFVMVIFFWYLAYESNYYRVLPFIYILILIYLFLIYFTSKVRSESYQNTHKD
ncbi:MAG: hypothetical protein IPH94_12425 [Saprospiraceae bacterium]|nr:hypothetical protein [Saprospiraceae bacterium]